MSSKLATVSESNTKLIYFSSFVLRWGIYTVNSKHHKPKNPNPRPSLVAYINTLHISHFGD